MVCDFFILCLLGMESTIVRHVVAFCQFAGCRVTHSAFRAASPNSSVGVSLYSRFPKNGIGFFPKLLNK